MNTPHEIPTDPTKLHRYAVADQLDPDDAPDEIDAPRYQLVSEEVTADGRRIRRYSNRPNPTTKEHEMNTDPTTLAGILASLTAEPVRHLTTLDREAWSEATAELQGWLNGDGTPLHITTAEQLCAEHLAASPSTPRPLARVKVARALSGLVAKKNLRLGQVQFGDDTATDPVAVLMACPDGTRLAADGYEAVVVIWWPDGVFTFTDESTGEEVSLPNLYRGRASGYARAWRNVDHAVEEFDKLKDAMRTLRKLSSMDGTEPEAADTGKPSAAQSII